ncbi:MAG: flavodoxin domain-containing protein, partial [Verrucomicrobiota bacterium]|nr:flavodoxin domain-containing protein [Verrucomicrobiota bacterium]
MSWQLRDNVHWVGHVDWTVRDFHGYRTESGSTYNAYLVKDARTALVDTVKAPFAVDLPDHVRALVPLDAVHYIVCNHAEPDHSGALPAASTTRSPWRLSWPKPRPTSPTSSCAVRPPDRPRPGARGEAGYCHDRPEPRRHLTEEPGRAILAAYRDWVVCKPRAKALVIYDTMWGSTAKMARAILSGAEADDVDAKLFSVRDAHNTMLVTEVLDAAVLAVGSPTLNGGLMPQMASFLTYLKDLRPAGKAGFAFGSHGWARGGARDVQDYLKETGVTLLREPLDYRYAPDEKVLDECRQAGRILAESARRRA